MKAPASRGKNPAGKGPGRPQDTDTEGTRQRILEGARELFAMRGFEGAGIREIAQRAEVNSATVHYHFGSKDELYRRVVGDAASVLFQKVEAASRSEGPVSVRLHRALQAYAEVFSKHPYLPRIVFSALTGGTIPSHEWLMENYASKGAQILPGILMEGMRNGELRTVDVRFTFIALASLCFFIHLGYPGFRRLVGLGGEEGPADGQQARLQGPAPALAEAYTDHFFDLLMNGLRASTDSKGTQA